MIFLSRNKSLFVFYFAVVKPFFVFSQANMSSIIDPGKFSVAYVTVPNAGVGKTLGNEIIKNKLAACVNIIPQVTSIYEWKGEITEDNESLLMIKTTTKLVDKLTVFIRSKHPYEVCEVIALPIRNGNPPYLKWIEDTVQEE